MGDSSKRSKRQSDLFKHMGGRQTCELLSDEFHRRISGDPILRPLFPGNMKALTGHFSFFIEERFGGDEAYTAKRGKQSLLCKHAHLSISTEEAERWLFHMVASLEAVGVQSHVRERLRTYFIETAQTLTDPYIPFYDLSNGELAAKIAENPLLVHTSVTGHSLLREAICRWDEERVRLLLESGADANFKEPLGHGALYRATNASVQGLEAKGRNIVRLLIKCGTDVNAKSGPGKSTPLHMAARRGHVLLAEELIAGGADIEAKDSKGETPLRRAANCGQEHVVRFLLSRGANPLSRDKQNRTPLETARRDGIRQALQEAVNIR